MIFSIKKDLNACERIITFLGLTFRFKSKILYFRKKEILQNKIIVDLEKQKKAVLNNLKKQIPVKDSYKYIHIMYNEKFNKPFVDFLNSSFNPDEHLILCNRRKDENSVNPFPQGNNVYEYCNNLEETLEYLNINLSSDKFEKIILHSLMDKTLVEFLYNNKELLKKSYWLIWGADLYNAPRDEVNDFVRKNVKAYVSDTDGDCKVASERYNSCAKTYDAGYTFPITKEMLSNTKRENHDYIQIQINNSCDKSVIEMLDILSKFKNENIKIKTILSYGNNMGLKQNIIKMGKEIFKNKFEYLDEMLSPQEYAQYVADNDILILNQNRQQGLGNSFVALALGAKLYIKSDVTTYNHFNSRGIKVFDTYSIKNMTFEDFISYNDSIKQSNMEKSMIFFDDNYLKELWSNIFYE